MVATGDQSMEQTEILSPASCDMTESESIWILNLWCLHFGFRALAWGRGGGRGHWADFVETLFKVCPGRSAIGYGTSSYLLKLQHISSRRSAFFAVHHLCNHPFDFALFDHSLRIQVESQPNFRGVHNEPAQAEWTIISAPWVTQLFWRRNGRDHPHVATNVKKKGKTRRTLRHIGS